MNWIEGQRGGGKKERRNEGKRERERDRERERKYLGKEDHTYS